MVTSMLCCNHNQVTKQMPTKRIPTELREAVTAILNGVTLDEVITSLPISKVVRAKGGKGCEAEYQTFVKKVPESHTASVDKLVNAYFKPANEAASKPTNRGVIKPARKPTDEGARKPRKAYGLNERFCTSESEDGDCDIDWIAKDGFSIKCIRRLDTEKTEQLYFLLEKIESNYSYLETEQNIDRYFELQEMIQETLFYFAHYLEDELFQFWYDWGAWIVPHYTPLPINEANGWVSLDFSPPFKLMPEYFTSE